MIRESDRLDLVAEAARAPSAHNTQPARWRFLEPDRIVLFEALDARLPAADPEGRDATIGLGAAWEGMALALSRRGLGLTQPRGVGGCEPDAVPSGVRPVAEGRIVANDARDPLADRVLTRRTFRGRFTSSLADVEALKAFAADRPDVVVLESRNHIRELARIHDRASARFFRRLGYASELCEWLRLSPSHPRWDRDGLSADCLALSGGEAMAARIVMRPPVLRVLTRLGLVGLVVSEAAATRSAAVLLVLEAPNGDLFHAGRLFYRRWLELDAAGWSACPMSALVDDEEGVRAVSDFAGLPLGSPLVNVLRVGRTPNPPPATSARLSPERLIV